MVSCHKSKPAMCVLAIFKIANKLRILLFGHIFPVLTQCRFNNYRMIRCKHFKILYVIANGITLQFMKTNKILKISRWHYN